MKYKSVKDLVTAGAKHLEKGPISLVFVEDDVEVDSTLRHNFDAGFQQVFAFMPDAFTLADDLHDKTVRIRFDISRGDNVISAINQVIAAAPDLWMYYCFNAEYLFFPFCETRTVGEMITFHTEERRRAMLTYVVDLYADNLDAFPSAVSLERAHLDRSGYYALARPDPNNNNYPKDRQLDFFGGLRWRFEEHVPATRRKIDRISIFKSAPDLELREDFTFSDEEYNTYACEWHNNLTASICSFRTAKALKKNPGSMFEIPTFRWHNTVPFEWHSRQLMDIGLMEPGQWF